MISKTLPVTDQRGQTDQIISKVYRLTKREYYWKQIERALKSPVIENRHIFNHKSTLYCYCFYWNSLGLRRNKAEKSQ